MLRNGPTPVSADLPDNVCALLIRAIRADQLSLLKEPRPGFYRAQVKLSLSEADRAQFRGGQSNQAMLSIQRVLAPRMKDEGFSDFQIASYHPDSGVLTIHIEGRSLSR